MDLANHEFFLQPLHFIIRRLKQLRNKPSSREPSQCRFGVLIWTRFER